MGKRLHVATTYKVKWGEKATFNWKVVEFKDLLDFLGAHCCDLDPDFTDGYGNDFECPKDEFENAIKALEKYVATGELEIEGEAYDAEELEEALKAVDKTKEEVLKDLKEYLETAEPDADYLHFAFF